MCYKFKTIKQKDRKTFLRAFKAAKMLFNCSSEEKNSIRISKRYHRGYEQMPFSETFLYGYNTDIKNIYPKGLKNTHIMNLEECFEIFMRYGKQELNDLDYLNNKTLELNNPRIKISKYSSQSLNQIVCGEHYDHGILTLNMSDRNRELEFKENSCWEFISDDSTLGYISFPGGQAESLSLGKTKALTHRVLNKTNTERISFSLFLEAK